MSILIIVLIARTTIFLVKYKILGFRAGSSRNRLRPKIPKAQIGLARKTYFFELIKLSPNPVFLRIGGIELQDSVLIDMYI